MKKKRMPKTNDTESMINGFLKHWHVKEMVSFLTEVSHLFELYNVCDEDDWIKDAVGEFDATNVRLIQSVYLMSKIADTHSDRLSLLKSKYGGLWRRLENIKTKTENLDA